MTPCAKCGFRFIRDRFPDRCPRCKTLRPFAAERVARENEAIDRQLNKRRVK